ncbi:MAG: folate-binding protein [Microbacteriaceae bacterium]
MSAPADPSPFLSLPAAVSASGRDAGVAAHYGNPLVEQRRLVEGRAIVDLSHRAVLTITGQERLSWLNSISSQNLVGLKAGESSETLVLDHTGRLEHAARVVDDGHSLWLLLEGGESLGLLSWLQKMKFMLRVEVADRTAEFATIGSLGPLPQELPVAESNGIRLVWQDPWVAVSPGGHQYALAEEHPGAGWTWRESLVPRTQLDAVARAVASGRTGVAGLLAVEALRIQAWRPRFATEVDEKTIPHELDWLRTAVSLEKGCYRGQETVAKVHNLGHPPRRLVMLHLDGSDSALPVPGDSVWLDRDGTRQDVGVITSSAMHYELGPIALAVIKRRTDPAAMLFVDAEGLVVSAAQEVVVPPDAGAEADVPRLARLGGVTRPTR